MRAKYICLQEIFKGKLAPGGHNEQHCDPNNSYVPTPSRGRTSPLARLDLQDEEQRRLMRHELVRRMHGGRWPLFRCVGMRQIDGVIYEAVEWLRLESPRFGVVRRQQDGLGLS